MKPFDNLDKNIDKYYADSLDPHITDQCELKEALDMMTTANKIDNIVSIPTDVSLIIEKGQEVRLKTRLRKETFKFIPIAILIVLILTLIAIKSSLIVISIIQITLSILLVSLIVLLPIKRNRREEN